MPPDILSFLSEFDKFYQALVRDLKENKYNEVEFYLIIIAKVKAMDRVRRERGRFSLNEGSD
ncbi:hypothetical protein ES695_09100 [Candidatus Atribacteria bacterium 1244-E10-H5-B2]|nr:MAG: hypothetical protein ES695_09100 [Candidatus Atribacteria bacterium 1244-E10-H5-B2]